MNESVNPADHIGLAAYAANKWRRRKGPVMDSQEYSDACVALVKAARLYDSSRGVKFSTYALRSIFYYLDMTNRRRQQKKSIAMEKTLYFEIENAQAKSEPLSIDLREEVDAALNCLTPKEKRILVAKFIKGKSCKQIGQEQRRPVCATRIEQIVLTSIRKIRKQLGVTECT